MTHTQLPLNSFWLFIEAFLCDQWTPPPLPSINFALSFSFLLSPNYFPTLVAVSWFSFCSLWGRLSGCIVFTAVCMWIITDNHLFDNRSIPVVPSIAIVLSNLGHLILFSFVWWLHLTFIRMLGLFQSYSGVTEIFFCPHTCTADQTPIGLCTCASVSSSFFQSNWPPSVSIRLSQSSPPPLLSWLVFKSIENLNSIGLTRNWPIVLISAVRVSQIDVQFNLDFDLQSDQSINSIDLNLILPVSAICLHFGAIFRAFAALSWQLVSFARNNLRSLCVCLYSAARFHWWRRRRRLGRIRTFRSVARQPSTRVDAFLFSLFSNSIRSFRSVFDQTNPPDWFFVSIFPIFHHHPFCLPASSVVFVFDRNRLVGPIFVVLTSDESSRRLFSFFVFSICVLSSKNEFISFFVIRLSLFSPSPPLSVVCRLSALSFR